VLSARNAIILTFTAGLLSRVALAQDAASAIEQARLFQQQQTPAATATNSTGAALATGDVTSSDDDSFGAQMILKDQPKHPKFFVVGDTSFIYSNNVALTHRDERSDGLFIANAGAGWHPTFGHFEADLGFHLSTFRYFNTSALDFNNLGAGIGLTYNIPQWQGASLFSRYDFTELLNDHSREILSDHEFTFGGQKIYSLGRAHYFIAGLVATAGISDPHAAQRDQLGGFIGYHLNLTRKFESDLLYRPSAYFYNAGSRRDFNQVVSATLRYRFNNWASAEAFLSYSDNHSNRRVFGYDALSTGGGAGLRVNF
jgi:hypothetical protein